MDQHKESQLDFIELGPARPSDEAGESTWRGRRRPRAIDIFTGVVVAVAVVANIWHGQSGSSSRQPGSADVPSTAKFSSPLQQPAAAVRHVNQLPGLPADWALLALSGQSVVRVDLAAGSLQTTPARWHSADATVRWQAESPVVLGATGTAGNAAISRDTLVPLGGAVATSPVVLPGPRPDEVWIAAPGHQLQLVGLDGWPTDQTVSLPASAPLWDVNPDGAGFLLVRSAHGVYATQPGRRQFVTRGEVVAIGPSGWLARECTRASCRLVFVGRHDGVRRVLRASFPEAIGLGLIAPDGRHVAMHGLSRSGTSVVVVVGLRGDRASDVAAIPAEEHGGDPGAWSPDGRYLFVAEANGGVASYDTRKGTTTRLGQLESPLVGLTVRSVNEPSADTSPERRCKVSAVDRWFSTDPTTLSTFCRAL
jgi:hypothetical protein